MTWSMRSAPARAMFARSVAMKGAYALSTSPRGESGGNPQFWPRGLKASGGAPTAAPSA